MQRKYGSDHVHLDIFMFTHLVKPTVRDPRACQKVFCLYSSVRRRIWHFLGEGCQSTTPVWHSAAKCTLDPHKKRPNFVANPMLPKYSKANKSMKMGAILLFWLKGRSKINLTGMLWPTCVWFQRESTIIFTLSVLALWIQKMKIWRRHF